MNRRDVLTAVVGSLGSLAMMNRVVADDYAKKDTGKVDTLAIKTCPIYMCMNNGSFATYYAMETTASGGAPCSIPRMWLGPPNLSGAALGCPNGTACASRLTTLKATEKATDDDVGFADTLETDGAPGAIAFPQQLPRGVFQGRSGRYRLRGQNKLKKGKDQEPGNQPKDADVILREIIMVPLQFNPSMNEPAKIFYFAQEVDVDESIPENPVFGSIKKVAKLKTDGHHFRIKLNKPGQGGGSTGDSDFEFNFTLLARKIS